MSAQLHAKRALFRVAQVVLYPPDAVQALRHGRPVEVLVGLCLSQGLEQRVRLLVRSQCRGRFARCILQVAHRDQALARLQLGRGDGLGSAARASRSSSPRLRVASASACDPIRAVSSPMS